MFFKQKLQGSDQARFLIARHLLLHCGCHWRAFSRCPCLSCQWLRAGETSPPLTRRLLSISPALTPPIQQAALSLSSLLVTLKLYRPCCPLLEGPDPTRRLPFSSSLPKSENARGCTEQALVLSTLPQARLAKHPSSSSPAFPPAFQIHHLALITIVSCASKQ